MGERCTVEGTVQSVVFQNEENGYTVLSLLTEQGEVVTVVGCIPYAAPGEGMTVTGVWITHPLYGPQITCEQVERRMPREWDRPRRSGWWSDSARTRSGCWRRSRSGSAK